MNATQSDNGVATPKTRLYNSAQEKIEDWKNQGMDEEEIKEYLLEARKVYGNLSSLDQKVLDILYNNEGEQ